MVFYLYPLESCGTVPNPEKSRLSRPAGQTGQSRNFFGTGQTGPGQFGKIRDGTNGIRDNTKKLVSRIESCRTVQNLEKSRLSRPAGQTGQSRNFFGTGQTRSGQFEKIRDGTNGIRDYSKIFGTGQTGFGTIRKFSG